MDSTTFSLLPNLDYISIENCNFKQCLKAFAPLTKLNSVHVEKGTFPLESETFEDNSSITSISLQDVKIPMNPCFQFLKLLKTIEFDTCFFQNLNKILFSGLDSLEGISISNCKIQSIDTNIFEELSHLEGLNIRDSEIEEIDFASIHNLKKLKFFSFHHNKINGSIDYSIFEQLPSLSTIHFDLDVYEIMNFESFPHLETVKIGYVLDEEDSKSIDIVERLNSKGIKTEYVFCGTIDCSSDQEECC